MILARSASEALAIRSAAVGLVELHRGYPDVHHDAIDRRDALRGANIGEIGEPVLDQCEPAARPLNEIEPARYRRPVAVDADDAGSSHLEDSPAVATGAKGGVEVNAAVVWAQHFDRLAAKHGNMAWGRRIHAPAPGAGR